MDAYERMKENRQMGLGLKIFGPKKKKGHCSILLENHQKGYDFVIVLYDNIIIQIISSITLDQQCDKYRNNNASVCVFTEFFHAFL
jgi:hypothetical protein